MLKVFKTLYHSNHSRTSKVKKNIFAICFFRGVNIIAGFILVRMSLDYLGVDKYGVWLTIGSLVNWLCFFDIGLGGGLRNKLAEVLAHDNKELAKVYVSTAYTILFFIIAIVLLTFFIINRFLDWEVILCVKDIGQKELASLALWMVFFFGIKLQFGLINSLLKADQRPAVTYALEALSSFLSVGILYILIKHASGSLFYLGFWRSFVLAIVPLLASIWFFSGKYRDISFSLKCIDFKHSRGILNLGVKFFVIQLCAIVIFSTDNIIISHILGPGQVASYNVVYKYFLILTVLFSSISAPLWSAYTEAYVKKDYKWIENTFKKMLKLLIPSSVVVALMISAAKPIIVDLWIGKDIGITFSLVVLMGFYVLLQIWNRIYSWLLNGLGQLDHTFYTMILGAIINIPLSVFFAKTLSMGNAGVILGTIFSLSIFGVIGPLQVSSIFKKMSAQMIKK